MYIYIYSISCWFTSSPIYHFRNGNAELQLNDLQHPGVPIHQEVLGNQDLGARPGMVNHWICADLSCPGLEETKGKSCANENSNDLNDSHKVVIMIIIPSPFY